MIIDKGSIDIFIEEKNFLVQKTGRSLLGVTNYFHRRQREIALKAKRRKQKGGTIGVAMDLQNPFYKNVFSWNPKDSQKK